MSDMSIGKVHIELILYKLGVSLNLLRQQIVKSAHGMDVDASDARSRVTIRPLRIRHRSSVLQGLEGYPQREIIL